MIEMLMQPSYNKLEDCIKLNKPMSAGLAHPTVLLL